MYGLYESYGPVPLRVPCCASLSHVIRQSADSESTDWWYLSLHFWEIPCGPRIPTPNKSESAWIKALKSRLLVCGLTVINVTFTRRGKQHVLHTYVLQEVISSHSFWPLLVNATLGTSPYEHHYVNCGFCLGNQIYGLLILRIRDPIPRIMLHVDVLVLWIEGCHNSTL